MTAWYNEIDPYAAQWLRNLIQANLIAPGIVDTRPIQDVKPHELASYTQCHFFAGIGGWSQALRLAAWPDHRPVWTGSCPCQPFSQAGKRRGFDDERHLWPFWQYLIEQRRPPTIFGEQVARASDWLWLVRGDLEALGYSVGAIPMEAASTGADQLRDRFWFVATAERSDSGGRADQPQRRSPQRVVVGGTGENFAAGGVADRSRQRVDRTGPAGPAGRDEPANGCVGSSSTRPQGRRVLSERRDQGIAGQTSLADDLGLPGLAGAGWNSSSSTGPQAQGDREWRVAGNVGYASQPSGPTEWVIGADGKARRVEPGVRLLAHAVPQRVAKLRAFGNAIVPPCAKEFIAAYMDCAP